MDLLLSKIDELIENGNIVDDNLKNTLSILSSALNDWRTEVLSIYLYLNEIEMYMHGEANKKSIGKSMNEITSTNGWEVESLWIIYGIYNYYTEELTLKEIFDDIISKVN